MKMNFLKKLQIEKFVCWGLSSMRILLCLKRHLKGKSYWHDIFNLWTNHFEIFYYLLIISISLSQFTTKITKFWINYLIYLIKSLHQFYQKLFQNSDLKPTEILIIFNIIGKDIYIVCLNLLKILCWKSLTKRKNGALRLI